MKTFFSQHRFVLILFAITILTLLTRFIFIDRFPSLLLQDEAGLGYSAISIAETGKDEWGASWPVLFKSFGEYKAGVYMYVTAAIYSIVGWHPALARYASALAGTFLAPALAWFIYLYTRSKKAALVAALLVFTSPWAFHLSRQAVETNLALFFFVIGLCFFVSSKKAKRSYVTFLPAAFFFALSMYTYQVYKLYIPLFLLGYLATTDWWIPIRQHFKRNTSITVLLTALFTLPLLFIAGGSTRLEQVISVKPEVIQANLTLRRDTCYLLLSQAAIPKASMLCRSVWNITSISVSLVIADILEHFNPSFLFFVGDTSLNRNPTLSGAFFFFLLPFFYQGILELIKKGREERYLLVGILVALVPSIIAGTPHALRMTPVFPFVILCIVLGIQSFKYRFTYLLVSLTVCILFICHIPEYVVACYANSQEFVSYSKEVAQQAYSYWQRDT